VPADQLIFLGLVFVMVAVTVTATVRYMCTFLGRGGASNGVEPSWFSPLVRR